MRTVFLVMLLLAFTGCNGPPSDSRPRSGGAEAANPPLAAGSGKCQVRYARGFSLSYQDGYKVLTVFEPGSGEGSKKMNTFVLVPRGSRPQRAVGGTVVEIPVRRVALRSATHVPFFSMLGLMDRVIAITQGKYVYDPEVSALIRRGRIAEVGLGSGMTAQFDVEQLITLRPDLVLSWWTNNPAYAAHLKVQEAGLPVALLADYEETTLLGRTEWIKFVAAFFDAEAEAERVFDDLEERYFAMAAKTRNVRHRPTVMSGSAYQGSWYIGGGKSFVANLIQDAGGEYIWADDDTTGSRPVNAETVMIRGKHADYWFMYNENHLSLASLAAEDPRYRLFRAFQKGRIYSNNGKIGPGGGNDYYQGTVARPDLLLADMIAILHPDLLPGHKLSWYLHLPPTISNGATHTPEQGK